MKESVVLRRYENSIFRIPDPHYGAPGGGNDGGSVCLARDVTIETGILPLPPLEIHSSTPLDPLSSRTLGTPPTALMRKRGSNDTALTTVVDEEAFLWSRSVNVV